MSRATAQLGAGAAVTTGLAALALADPFHLRYAGPYAAVLVTLAILLVTLVLVRTLPGRGLRVLAATSGALLGLGWLALVWLAAEFAGPDRVVDEVASAGDERLVVVEGHAFVDVVYSVRLRAGSGPLAQEALVWQGLADGAPPSEVRFAGEGVVEVVASGVCGYRSTFDPVTLDVDPVHRPLRLDGC
jgi:hypothetical protein